ncbi:sn-glycerol-3-phosphate transport ABC transporter ATP-binding protein UgpC [Mycobacterium tuberculosis M1213]|nr:sn-glycerol-3-phosphate transport ABC transporter ATP-binding protein UgpC [Mycobacterium tuberculosis M1212]KAX87683.1 sn-glycerol-3-phosphate transport ABC transporter ATP-binding protein UgpC [Mycobacterium tuberculosis M1213]
MANVQYSAVTQRYPGADAPTVDNLDLDIADGEFLVLVGPSGCGKSTTLRVLAGLEPIESGRISIGDVDVTHLPPRARDVAMVFQNYALYPNMTVAANMGFALRNAGMSRADTRRRVLEVADMLELTDLLDRKPAKLSGGQRQRVAMGRAIVRRAPGVLHGRAAVESGRQAAGEHPLTDLRIAASVGHHHRLRHPRSGGGDDDGRPGGGAQRRCAATG